VGNKELKICNLYCGIGGNRRLWGNDHEITAVELDPKIAKIYQDFFPNDKVIVADAHQYLLEHFKEFEFIWSSPPCPTHSNVNNFLHAQGCIRYPDLTLWQEIIFLKHFCKTKFCIENVKSYYQPILSPIERDRHFFWSNFFISEWESGTKKDLNISVTNCRSSTRRECRESVKILEEYLGFDLSKYKIQDKQKALANCVNPYLGLHILNESKKGLYQELFK